MNLLYSIKVRVNCHGHVASETHEIDVDNVARFLELLSRYGTAEADAREHTCIKALMQDLDQYR